MPEFNHDHHEPIAFTTNGTVENKSIKRFLNSIRYGTGVIILKRKQRKKNFYDIYQVHYKGFLSSFFLL